MKQEIMLKLVDELSHLGAKLAFPTRTVQFVRPAGPGQRPDPGAAAVRPVAKAIG